MRQTKDFLMLAKLAEAAAERTTSIVARKYWFMVAEENRRLAEESLDRPGRRQKDPPSAV